MAGTVPAAGIVPVADTGLAGAGTALADIAGPADTAAPGVAAVADTAVVAGIVAAADTAAVAEDMDPEQRREPLQGRQQKAFPT